MTEHRMVETIEFRIPETLAAKFLPPNAGKTLGIARKLVLRRDEALFAEVGRLEREFRARGDSFFTAWIPHRTYSRPELAQAVLLQVILVKKFQPAGEECGTAYDDASGCPNCGGGALQTTPLFLDPRRIPKGTDVAETIAGEVVVSKRVVDLFREHQLRGATFEPVRPVGARGAPSADHYQLNTVSPAVEIVTPTEAGENPFDDDHQGRCPRGDVIGPSLLSELTVRVEKGHDADIMSTRQLIGVRRGLLRPRPLLVVSSRTWRAFEENHVRGVTFEVTRVRQSGRSQD